MSNRSEGAVSGAGIIGWFASNPVAANLLMILVMILGLFEMGSLRKEAFPSQEPNQLSISVAYNSGSAKQSEEGLAIKIEEQLKDVIGIKSITSSSNGSGAHVSVEKQSGYDLDVLQQDISAKIDSISSFPAGADNPVISKSQRQEHAIWLQIFGEADRHTLQLLAEALKSDLLDHDDINKVSISGWLDPMMIIEMDEARLQSYGLSLSAVEEAINKSSSTPLSAVLRNKSTYIQLKASEQAYVARDFAAIPLLTTNDGRQILLGDVATIQDGYDDDTAVLSRFNQNNSIALQIVTTGQDDISDSVNGAKETVERWIEGNKLPNGVELLTWSDRSTSINERLQLLVKNAVTGIALVFILLALFLNLRVAFWVAAGLPFIFLGTLYFMGDSYMGLSLNEFTTFGFIMALGIVVDDAVVVGESIYSVRSQEGDTLDNTIKGTMQVAVPTLFGVFTTVAAFFALSNIDGMLGQLYAQFAVIVTICLILSIVESKLILPAHLSHLNTRRVPSSRSLSGLWQKVQHGADSLFVFFNARCYAPSIKWAMSNRYTVFILFIAMFIVVIAMPFNGAVRISFFPDIAGDTVRAEISMVQDASFGMTHANLNKMEKLAYVTDKELSGTDDVFVKNLQIMSQADQSGKITVELSDDAPYNINEFTKLWREKVGTPEGSRSVNIQNAPRMVDALRVELRSSDDSVLLRAGDAFKEELLKIPGVSGIEDNLESGQPQLNLKLNQQGRALGLTTAQLASQIMQEFSGQVVQRYQRNNDEIEVKVRYPEADRENPSDVINARVRTNDGTVVPLSSVATVTYGYTQDTITRIDGKRAMYLSAEVDKDTISSSELVANLKQTVGPQLEQQFPGVDVHFGGEAEQQEETQSSMTEMFILAMLVIYMLLAIPLKSYVQPLLIMMAIPFGIVGAILGHWLTDLSLGILSLNGIIALSGVVVNDSLLLVARYNDLKTETKDQEEAIIRACRSRLRAVMLTSLTTFAGLMPLLSETSFQAQFLIPAAVSLGYGILFATIITLVLTPVLLYIQLDIIGLYNRTFKRMNKTTVNSAC